MFNNKPPIFQILIAFFLISSLLGYNQTKNMVLNPSFEGYEDCPDSHNPENQSRKIIPSWTYPSIAAPDYFNRCSSGDADVPVNFAGTSEPKTGDGYIGAILTGTAESRREYLQGELVSPLMSGRKYCVTYWYRLASGSRLAVDQISVYFINEWLKAEGTEALNVKPQLNNIPGLFLDNVEDWERACYVYDAKGGEKFFIIGNFNNYDNTNYVVTDKNVVNLRNKAYAYYYFDEVVIQPLDNCIDCPCIQHDFEASIVDTFYTGGRDPMTGDVKKNKNDGRIRINMIGGTPPYDVKWNNGMKGAFLENLPAGQYVYVANDFYNCNSQGKITFIQPVKKEDNFIDGLKNIEEGASIVLENIFFEFNKTDLLPQSYIELDKVAEFLLDNNINKIEISGHTDNEGSGAYNQKLSEGRAASVVQYLIDKGITLGTIQSMGYGESRPIDTNQTEQGRAQNRRVEFTLIKR